MNGDTIDGRYRILRVLGQGGMGAVHEAEHVGTRRRVAVKVIIPEMAKKAEMVRRFQREARAAGSIETPHIVQVFDTGTDASSGVIYMVMELLRGEDLQQLLKRIDKLPPRLALRLVGQACMGLSKAHEAGVIHRDIKPANLFLSQQDNGEVTVKVVDFGIAKIKVDVASSGEAALTHTGGMLGSPLYMSPEQARGQKTLDHRTDIWSIGVVLYQALTGRVPHPADTIGALVMAICLEPAPPIQDLAPWVPPEIALLVHRALAIDQDARFPSVAAMLEALRRVVPEGFSIQADALVPLTEAELAHVALRAVLNREMTRAPSSSSAGVPSSPEIAPPGSKAELSLSRGSPSPRVMPGRSRLAPALALSAVLGGGFVAYKLVGRDAAVAPNSGLVVAALPPAAASSSLTVALVPPPDERTVRLVIGPPDATVDVDDLELPIKNSGVELRGAVWSVHRVRIRKGNKEAFVDVVITPSGVVPPQVQLEAAEQNPSTRPAAPSGVGSPRAAPPANATTTAASATAAAKPKDPAFREVFE